VIAPLQPNVNPPTTIHAVAAGLQQVETSGMLPGRPRPVGDLTELPPIPLVATRVMVLVQDSETTADQLARVVSTDQGLTAKLIRLSNSAEYAFGRPCASARDAIHLLGFLQVRQIAITSSLMSIFHGRLEEDSTFDSDLFWAHSLTVAVAAETLARATKAATPADAFTAGILHDLGRLAIRRAMPEEFRLAGEMALEDHIPLHEAELAVTGYSHEVVGQELAERWQFPAPLATAIGTHHQRGLTVKKDGLAGVVAQCDRMVLAQGITCGYYGDEPECDPNDPETLEVVRLVGGIESVMSRAAWFMDKTLGAGTPR
jgi:putative nucleotidyltransferase with HDIG domain